MNNLDYKKESHNLYKNNNFLEAYKCAWNLPLTDFLYWYTDVRGKRKKINGITFFNDPFFYNTFLITQSAEWLECQDALQLWEYYLNTQKDVALDFEMYVAHNNPTLFIEGYKKRLVFLDEKRLIKLQKQHLPLPIITELKIWNRFNSLLNQNWENVQVLFKDIKLLPYEICMAVIAAFEASIYNNPDDKLQWHYAVETLSVLIAFIQNKFNLNNLEVDNLDLTKAYCEGAIELKAEAIFNEVYDYVLLREKAHRYSYEPELKVFIDNNQVLHFNESDSFNKQWKYDEHRYNVNERSYYVFGELLYNEAKFENKIKYINDNKSPNNQLGNARQIAIKRAIYDLGISDEDFTKKKLPNLNFMISFLHGIAWRKTEITEAPLHKIARMQKNEYAKGMAELIIKNETSEFVLISDTTTLFNAASASGINCEEKEFDQFIKVFSFNWISEIFDPFKLPINLWKKPFIQIGNNIISPISILTGFSGLYTISESILKNFSPRDGKRIEPILKDTYQNAGWKTSMLKNNQDYGDVDVVMEDDENIILMQLKRTTQKLNMFQLHNQLPQDRKATKQLIEAKSVNTSGKKIHLWYVTTAFEKINTINKEVYRVSYQDLIHLNRLQGSEELHFNTLSDFIELIESDTPYKIGKELIK
ncbi:hypothetical protein [Patiriisocius marinus]|uniref:hypothetical protein n=1 Tax=Patiriisocius marinus TaxID=1397112 RepID=UPI0023300631|nr:hypothetical protein [Patiriisocius marinus]